MQYLYVTSEYDPTIKSDIANLDDTLSKKTAFVPTSFLHERFGEPEELDDGVLSWEVAILIASNADLYGKQFNWVVMRVTWSSKDKVQVTGGDLSKMALERMWKAVKYGSTQRY